MLTTITANASSEIMSYSIIAIVTLLAFLVAKELLNSEAEEKPELKRFVSGINLVIVPLLIVFLVILILKISRLPR